MLCQFSAEHVATNIFPMAWLPVPRQATCWGRSTSDARVEGFGVGAGRVQGLGFRTLNPKPYARCLCQEGHLDRDAINGALPGLQQLPEGCLVLGACGEASAVIPSPPLDGLDQQHSCTRLSLSASSQMIAQK